MRGRLGSAAIVMACLTASPAHAQPEVTIITSVPELALPSPPMELDTRLELVLQAATAIERIVAVSDPVDIERQTDVMVVNARETLVRRLDEYIDANGDQPQVAFAMHLEAELLADAAMRAEVPDLSVAAAELLLLLRRFPDYEMASDAALALGIYEIDERASLNPWLFYACPNLTPSPTAAAAPEPTRAQALARMKTTTMADPYADCSAPDADLARVEYAWMSIGDVHFGTPGEVDEAISAYRHIADNRASPRYDAATYKVAWGFYRRDRHADVVSVLDGALIVWNQQGRPGSLRAEAIELIAVSLTEPWNGEIETDPVKAMLRARDMYATRTAEPHVREVLAALGAAFGELQAYAQGVEATTMAIDAVPAHQDNPRLYVQRVDFLEAAGHKAEADANRLTALEAMARGGLWHSSNADDSKAMQSRAGLIEYLVFGVVAALTNDADRASGDKRKVAAEHAVRLASEFLDEFPESGQADQVRNVLDIARELASK